VTEIQQNRWDQLVRRVSNVVGGGSQVNDTLNELFPTLDVERVPLELLYLSGWRIGFGAANQPAVAAMFSNCQIFNPQGSSLLLVPTQIFIMCSAASLIRYNIVNTALTTIGNSKQRDTRVGIDEQIIGTVNNQVTAGGQPSFGLIRTEANITFEFSDQDGLCVLSPGSGLQFATGAVNQELIISVLWRERTAEPAEVNF